MESTPKTKWNHNILNKYNNQTTPPPTHPHSNLQSNTNFNTQPSGYNRVETFDTSPLQLPLLTPLFHFSNSPPVLQNMKELGNNNTPSFNNVDNYQKNEAFTRMSASIFDTANATIKETIEETTIDDCDNEEDEADILVSDAAKPKYKSTYTPRVNTIDITDTNIGAKLEEPQVENNPFTSTKMNTPASQLKTKPEKFTNRWSSIIENMDDNKQPKLEDVDIDTDKTYEDTIAEWTKFGNAIKEYNPLGMLKMACVFVYDEILVKIILKDIFQQSLYDKFKEHYFMFIYLIISILVTYNLFYLYFYKDFQNERIAFIPVEKLNGFYILNYVIDPVKLMYSSLLIARDLIEDKLDEAYRKELIGKYDKYKIIIVMLFLFSIVFVSQFMGILYDAFFNTLSLKTDYFGNYVLILIVIYSFYSFGLEVCNDPTLRFWPVLIVSLIRFIVILIISTSFTWLAVFLICIIIFLSTVFPWMVIYSQQQFEIFQEINGFCDNLLKFKRLDRKKMKEDTNEFTNNLYNPTSAATSDMAGDMAGTATSALSGPLASALSGPLAGALSGPLAGTANSALSGPLGSIASGPLGNIASGPLGNIASKLVKGGGGDCITPDDINDKNGCHAPSKGFLDNIGIGSNTTFSLTLKNAILAVYKRIFYIAFIFLIMIHSVFYYQNVDSKYDKFREVLFICCAVIFFVLIFCMAITNKITHMVGTGLMGVTGLVVIYLFFAYNVVIYKFFSEYAKYGSDSAGIKI